VSDEHRYAQRGETFGKTIPYVVPDSLDDLTGPTSGVVSLPPELRPPPVNRYDLADRDEVISLYAHVITEARNTADLAQFLNRDLLLRAWPYLILPIYCYPKWHARFPQLAAIGRPDPPR
jgi:hypothetical protein